SGFSLGRRAQRTYFRGADVEHEPARRKGAKFGARCGEFLMKTVRNAKIAAQLDGFLQAIREKPRHMQSGQSLTIEPFLDPGDALIVDIDVADQVRNLGAIGIIAFVLVEKTDAGQALAINLALLLRGDFAPQPDKSALGRK